MTSDSIVFPYVFVRPLRTEQLESISPFDVFVDPELWKKTKAMLNLLVSIVEESTRKLKQVYPDKLMKLICWVHNYDDTELETSTVKPLTVKRYGTTKSIKGSLIVQYWYKEYTAKECLYTWRKGLIDETTRYLLYYWLQGKKLYQILKSDMQRSPLVYC